MSATVTDISPSSSGFAFPTSIATWSFSSCVSFSGFATTVNSGLFGVTSPATVFLVTASSFSTTFSEPSGYVIVTSPLSATLTDVPAGRSGFAFPISIATWSFSSRVNWSASATTVFSGLFGVVLSAVVLFSIIFSFDSVLTELSGYVIFTSPLSATSTVVPGSSVLFVSTTVFTCSFSSWLS